ncbi:MAG: hypothetical protein KKD28_08425 [Chloroflexi bacterium]|nr:hypothetical protein [Chloroflexota bacterium]
MKKRKARRHLPPAATLVDYNDIIRTVLSAPNAAVYVYWYKRRAYPSVATVIDGDYWLVMLSMDGFMESAYVVENPRAYLSWPDFEPLGSLSEVLA